MTLRWSEQDFEDWRNRRGAHADPPEKVIAERAHRGVKLAGPKKPGAPAGKRGMNKLEGQFAQTLDYRKNAGDLIWWAFEPFRIRLADGTFYRPDFASVDKHGRTEIYECKGFFREAARIRLKVAVEKLPYRFYLVRKHKGELRVTPV